MFSGPLYVRFVFDVEGTGVIIEPIVIDQPSKLRGDLDNYMKTTMDGLNRIAWGDDAQVVKIEAVKI